MTDSNNVDNGLNRRTYTEEEVFELFQRFKDEEKISTQRAREERELPVEIAASLDNLTQQQIQDHFKRYKREISKYYHEEWTVGEEINKSFIPKLKSFNVDTYQLVNTCYKGADISRTHGRAATEIFEQLYTIKNGNLSQAEAQQFWTKPLKVPKDSQCIPGPKQDNRMRRQKSMQQKLLDFHPASSIWRKKNLEIKEKLLVPNSLRCTTKPIINTELCKQQILLSPIVEVEEDIQHLPTGTVEEDEDFSHVEEERTSLEGRDVGPKPSTTTILTANHQLSTNHKGTTTVHNNTKPIVNKLCTTTIKVTASTGEPSHLTSDNNQLQHTDRRDSSRGSPHQISSTLENHHKPSLAVINNTKWVQDSIRQTTNSVEESADEKIYRRTIPYQFSSSEISGRRNNREITITESELSIEVFHPSREDQETPDPGLSKIEQFYPSGTFQNGGSARLKRANRARRLPLQDRLKRRLRGGSNSPRFKRLSKFRERRSSLPLQIVGFWPQRCTEGFLKDNEICNRTTEERRNSNCVLFGRHLFTFQIKRRNGINNNESKKSPGKIRLHYKLCKEYFNTFKDTGILGFPIQFKEDDNFGSRSENIASIEEGQTVTDFKQQDLSMDCRSTRENDLNDSRHRGSITSHQVLAEGSSSNSNHFSSQLGSEMSTIASQYGGAQLVGEVHGNEEWASNSEGCNSPKDHNTRGCFKLGLGGQFTIDGCVGFLESRGATTFNKRPRIEDDSDSIAIPLTKLRKLNHQDIFGQQNSLKIYNEIRRYNFNHLTEFSHRDSGNLQQIRYECNLSAHSGSNEHTSRQAQQGEETVIRDNDPKEDVSVDSKDMGKYEDRRLCSETQPPATALLDTFARPTSTSSGCNDTAMAEEGNVPLSTMEIDPSSIKEDTAAEIIESSTSDTNVDQPILVSDDFEDETFTTSNHLEIEQQMVSSRLAIINNSRLQDGLDQSTIDFLNKKIRQSTEKMYDNGWRHYETWCENSQPAKDPLEYNPMNVLLFLREKQEFSSNHLNTLRSSIASVFGVIHKHEQPIANHPLIKDFFAAKKKSVVKVPTQAQLKTWDINILINYIKHQLSPTANLSLDQLQRKTILLLCIATMWRPRSDIGRLQYRDAFLEQETSNFSVQLHSRAPKESQIKTITIGQHHDNELCPVVTLLDFINQTASFRTELPEDHTLFLTYLDLPEETSSSVKPATVANWITTEMGSAGIDTHIYQAHSIRAAASTKAVELGYSIQEVKKHANWSLNSNTFEKYYFKPSSQALKSTAICNSIFSSTEKRITSEVEVEATGIGLGTTSNTNVAETKTEDVIHTHPWYKRIFR